MNRRDFLHTGIAGSMTLAIATEAEAQAKKTAQKAPAKPPKMTDAEKAAAARKDDYKGAPVPVAVIGVNEHGRKLIEALVKLGVNRAPVTAICDNYSSQGFVNKSKENVPSARFEEDYRRILDDKNIKGIFIATPTHKHKQIVMDAIQAGKHVYCEMPLSNSIEEAKEIAIAGNAAKTFFMPGLQWRSNAQTKHVYKFIKSKANGDTMLGRAQWHQRSSWRRASPNEARVQELNWKLAPEISLGLAGEVGVHQFDMASWFFNAMPIAVTGFGSVIAWKDGRKVADTIQCVLEFPEGKSFIYSASLLSSYEGSYEIFYGTKSSILLRDQRGWMFKEADGESIGWEGYARRDAINIGEPKNNTGEKVGVGIALVADASKQLALGLEPGKTGTDVSKTALYQSLDYFTRCIGEDARPTVNALSGYQATVVAVKASQAVVNRTRVEFKPEDFLLSS